MDHPHQLYAVEFTEADQARLAGFSCGDQVWSRHVTEWIRGSDVLDSMDAAQRPQWLVLMVRGENARAIRFYEQCGFELIPGVVRRNNHVVMKLWIGEP